MFVTYGLICRKRITELRILMSADISTTGGVKYHINLLWLLGPAKIREFKPKFKPIPRTENY